MASQLRDLSLGQSKRELASVFRDFSQGSKKELASVFRDLSLGSKRESGGKRDLSSHPSSDYQRRTSGAIKLARDSDQSLPSPFGNLSVDLSSFDLRVVAYEIFLLVCRTSAAKSLSRHSSSPSSLDNNSSKNHASINSKLASGGNVSFPSSLSPGSQKSLTSVAASRMKKALGFKSFSSVNSNNANDSATKKPATVGDLMRMQMGITDEVDSLIRRALLKISSSQLGKRPELIVLPLELFQMLKPADFANQQEYESWQQRTLKVLDAGILLHPRVSLNSSNPTAQRLRQIIDSSLVKPGGSAKDSHLMQALRNNVMTLASRSDNSFTDISHWANGFPLNLKLYETLLECCFDGEGSLIEEADELMEQIQKTWSILGINQMYHNICFTWVLFNHFVICGQTDKKLLEAVDAQIMEVAKVVKSFKESEHLNILSASLNSILGWIDKRLLAYHDAFSSANIDTMSGIVAVAVGASKVLAEDHLDSYKKKRKGDFDVARNKLDTYIRSSLRTAFAQMMEKADSSRRASKGQAVLVILAKDVGELAVKEKQLFSPILKRWHPLAAGVASATLHTCFANEIKQFIGTTFELTSDSVEVLRAADNLEQLLVQLAVEDAADSDDGGKGIMREMVPFEAELAICSLSKTWIASRSDKLREWTDRTLQQETWNSLSNHGLAPSAVEILRLIDETMEAYFALPIPMHPALLPDLISCFDECIQYYATQAKSGCGSKSAFLPAFPALTRCEVGSNPWKKKDKEKASNVSHGNGSDIGEIRQLCFRINTIHRIKEECEVIEKRMMVHLRNSESAKREDFSNGIEYKLENAPASCVEAVQKLSESAAYKIVFKGITWNGLYVGDPSSNNITPVIDQLERILTVINENVDDRVATRVTTDVMRAFFEGFLIVLLAGGPSRAFTQQDYKTLEQDFNSCKDLFWANGDGIPADLIEKYSASARAVLPLFRNDSVSLIERYKKLAMKSRGSAARSKLPLPATSGQWDPNDADTVLRVLCHRKDETATKYLKKTYNLPKKL